MFVFKKEYTCLWKKEEKVCDSGFMKLSVWGQKIKVDFFFDHLPVTDKLQGDCYVEYESSKKKCLYFCWPVTILQNERYYSYQRRMEDEIVAVHRCFIRFPEEYVIQSCEEKNPVWAFFENEKKGDGRSEKEQKEIDLSMVEMVEKQKTDDRKNRIEKKDARKEETEEKTQGEKEWETESDVGSEAESDAGREAEKDVGGEAGEEVEKRVQRGVREEKKEEKPEIVSIQNLKKLLEWGDPFTELYYNSFLLHGFYQYHHLIMGKDFIGVPGNYYPREGMAARMMGFPYFIEEDRLFHAEKPIIVYSCRDTDTKKEATDIDQTLNKRKQPVRGCFGYYLREIRMD